ncbi:MAG: TIGR01777 family protein [Candidatus Omnitrophica bacterium]|nr:TIGR01777 family protein [Candidatus Omnitrophota bacterium]
MIHWDGKTLGEWCAALEGADAVLNFSGENISARQWTEPYKKILRDSRLGSTNLIVRAIAGCRNRPRVFISGSAVGYYGDAGESKLDEGSSLGSGFLADLCRDWEQEALEAQKCGVRVVLARMGIVLGHGGVLDKFIPPFRWYVGGPLGSGRQWMSWISGKDLVDVILFMIKNDSLEGPVNCVSPNPLIMNDFCSTLGSILKKPSWIRCPVFVLRAVLGEMSAVVLSSQRVMSNKLLAAGFNFQQPLMKDALVDIFKGAYK